MQHPQATILDVKTRYPLMGGWKASFVLGYRLPLPHYLRTIPSGKFLTKDYIVGIPFFNAPIGNVTIDELIVKIVFPEGSHSIRPSAFYPLDGSNFEVAPTYLDSLKRPVLVLTKRNLVQEHSRPVLVSGQMVS
jgi:oligosaccharyltransferase complex subunit alpha (ribophorin I)